MKKVDKMDNKRKLIALGLVGIAAVVILVMAATLLNKGNLKGKDEAQGLNQTVTKGENYTDNGNGTKVNTSDAVAKDKTVDGMTLSAGTIVYENGMTKLTSKIINNGVAKENLTFNVKFIGSDGNVMAESKGFVGAIKANETKFIDSYITLDVVNAKDVTYEIVK